MYEPLREFVQPWLDASKEEGKIEGISEMVGKMLLDSVPLKIIMKYAEMPEESIVKLAGNLGVSLS